MEENKGDIKKNTGDLFKRPSTYWEFVIKTMTNKIIEFIEFKEQG